MVKKAKSPPVAASPDPILRGGAEPLMERQAKELQELHGSLKVLAQVYTTDEVFPSLHLSVVAASTESRQCLARKHQLREVSAVNGEIDRVSVLELPCIGKECGFSTAAD